MKEIKFNELEKVTSLNDSKYLVYTGLIYNEQDIQNMNYQFHKMGLIPEDKFVISIYKITGNVLGSKSRSDVLIEFNREDLPINPRVRLNLGCDIKWLSDFVVNFKNDYCHE